MKQASAEAGRELIAKPEFFSVEDVTKHFDRHPDKLVAYVETGLVKDVLVLGIHIAQLAKQVGIPLVARGNKYMTLPEMPMKPNSFENINLILQVAYRRRSETISR